MNISQFDNSKSVIFAREQFVNSVIMYFIPVRFNLFHYEVCFCHFFYRAGFFKIMNNNFQFFCCLIQSLCLFFHVFSKVFKSVHFKVQRSFYDSFCNFVQKRSNCLNILTVNRRNQSNIQLVQSFFQKVIALVFKTFCIDSMVFVHFCCNDLSVKVGNITANLCALFKKSIKNFFLRRQNVG